MTRTRQSVSFSAFLAAAVLAPLALSTPRVLGDGVELVAMARKLAHFQPPWFAESDARTLDGTITLIPGPPRAFETVHFWMYPLLAVPFVWAAHAAGANVSVAFMMLNVLLFAIAVWQLLRACPRPVVILLAVSPILWWLDKVHTEVFTFSLLVIALTRVSSRPWLASIAAGLASTQNPPIAALIPMIVLLFPEARTRRAVPWIAASVALALLHPTYYLWRIGHWTPLLESDLRIPTLTRFFAVLVDLNIGLLVNAPWFVVAAGAGAMVAVRAGVTRKREMMLAVLAGAVFLFSFAQTMNVNHGGTPTMSRYALWLIPLVIPFLPGRSTDRGRKSLEWIFAGCAIGSAVLSIVWFRPSLPEDSVTPTKVAMFQWTRYPSLLDPVPEIFAERLRHQDGVNLLAATPGCEKVLLKGGVWPDPCTPVDIPDRCKGPEVLCYANREAGGYAFVTAVRR